jgi:membrane associated rhomboid family serine protease
MPKITKFLLCTNIIVFLAQLLLERKGIDLSHILGLHFALADDFNVLQLFTYMFLHGSWEHLFFNMFTLWMFGRIIEHTLGTKHFIIYYIICGIGAGFCQEIVQFAEYYINALYQYDAVNTGSTLIPMNDYLNMWTTIGASGAVYGILLAYGFLYPNERIMLLIPPIPIKAKYLVIGYAALELLLSFNSSDNVAHFAHLGGMIFGLILLMRWTRRKIGPSWLDRLSSHFKGKARPTIRVYQNPNPKPRQEEQPQASAQAQHQSDYEARRRKVDELLDKIKISGYESLTEEEKNFLFNVSNKKD